MSGGGFVDHIAYIYLLFFQLLYLIAILDLVHEYLSRFETGNVMFIYYQGGIAGDIPGNFFLSLLIDKAAKTSDVDVIAIRHGGFHNAEEGFHRCSYISFVNSGLFSDFVNDVCFRHNVIF